MIDLSTINSFYEFKWFDGETIHLPKPTEKFLRKTASLDADGDLTEEEIMDEVKKLVHEILRQNTDGRKFTKAELEQCDAFVCSMLLKDYLQETEARLGE